MHLIFLSLILQVHPYKCSRNQFEIEVFTQCSFDCNIGYKLTGGPRTIICLPNGLWSSQIPTCSRKHFFKFQQVFSFIKCEIFYGRFLYLIFPQQKFFLVISNYIVEKVDLNKFCSLFNVESFYCEILRHWFLTFSYDAQFGNFM